MTDNLREQIDGFDHNNAVTAERKATNLPSEIYDYLVERGYPDAIFIRNKIVEILKGESR